MISIASDSDNSELPASKRSAVSLRDLTTSLTKDNFISLLIFCKDIDKQVGFKTTKLIGST
jgi:hypothetical protein